MLVDCTIHHHQLRFCLIHGKHLIPSGNGRHFPPFLGCKSPLVSHQHAHKPGHDHYRSKGWTWTRRQISAETSAGGSSSSASVPICGVGCDDHESVWCIWLDIFSNTHLSLDHADRNTTSSSSDQLCSDSRWWEKNSFSSWFGRGHCHTLVWWSLTYAHVAFG